MADLSSTILSARIRDEIALRQRRSSQFDPSLFGEPAWDILLDLALCRIEGRRASVTDTLLACGAPSTTALRYVGVLEREGQIARTPDPRDRRRFWLSISDDGFDRIVRLFAPSLARNTSTDPLATPREIQLEGMSRRDYFAGQALAGLLANSGNNPVIAELARERDVTVDEFVAQMAFNAADAMLSEREPQS